MSEIVKIVGERVRSYRNQAGLSQESLAEKSGLSYTFISAIERGKKNPSIESIEKLVIAFNISYEKLFENIVPGENKNTIPLDCYNMVNSLTLPEQKAILDLLEGIIDFKQL